MMRIMPTKAQHHRGYRHVPAFLRELRENAELTQREIGKRLSRPQSWVYKCETGNRRVDLAEFCEWSAACGIDPSLAVRRFTAAR
jgi:transcriptional regulator with XRE-family HTH domain